MKKILIYISILALITSGCGLYKRSDIKDNPVNVKERVAKNIKEGRGVKFGKFGGTTGGIFDFASSNELWRASVEILDFVPFTNASYSGGILITEWFSSEKSTNNYKRDLKITVKFLSNEIRADGLKIIIHERICDKNNQNECNIKKISSGLESEIKLAILKKATLMEKNKQKEMRKKDKRKLSITKGEVSN